MFPERMNILSTLNINVKNIIKILLKDRKGSE